MTEKFEISIHPLKHYVKYKDSDHALAVIQFDIIKDGVPFNNGYNGRFECCDLGLKELIGKADDFLAGRITEKEQLSFVIPYIIGGYIRYSYFFDIFPGSHWVFNVAQNFNVEEPDILFSCEIRREQIEAMRDSLVQQMETFDWENYGKTEFFRFSLPDRDYEWCYSANELEQVLRERLVGDRLKKVYVSGMNFSGPFDVKENFVNYYLGSRVYLEFEKTYVDILAHAYGLFQIRFFQAGEVSGERFFDSIDNSDEILCDTAYPFVTSYTDETVTGVNVASISDWPWDAKSFDESKVGNPIELPEKIELHLSNNTVLSIIGWDDDFCIQMNPA